MAKVKFIVDAGPIIHLDQIGQIRLLKRLPSLIIPAGVAMEIERGADSGPLDAIRDWPNAKIIPVRRNPTGIAIPISDRTRLQRGEIDCIELAMGMRPCIFLTDDLAARTVAEKLSIEVHGSVGIVSYAVKRGWLSIEKAEESLNLLYHRSNLFIARAIIENAIQSIKDSL